MSHSTAVTRAEGHAPALAPEHVERVAEAVEAAQRPATRRNYRQAWDRFAAWCAGEGLDALPADPVTVGAYLAVRAESRSLATVRLDRAAISDRHRRAGHPTPTRSEGVRRTVKGLANVHADAGRHVERQAPGLTADCLAAIRATAHLPRTGPTGRTESADAAKRRGAVDVALASVMRDALLRRSEAAALTWAAVDFRPDGSARVTVTRSKTDAEPRILYAGRAAAAALRRIAPADPEPDARVFGMATGRTVSNRIAAMARAAGLGDGFSGHSPRVGMAQDLTASGASLQALQVAGRWKSVRMPARYSARERAARGAVAKYYRR